MWVRTVMVIVLVLSAQVHGQQATLILEADPPGGIVRPGDMIEWRLFIEVAPEGSRGLAGIAADLVTDLTALAPCFMLPRAVNVSSFPDQSLHLDLGPNFASQINDGTPLRKDGLATLQTIGGTQDSIDNLPALREMNGQQVEVPSGTVVEGVAQKEPVLAAHGSLTIPSNAVGGDFTLWTGGVPGNPGQTKVNLLIEIGEITREGTDARWRVVTLSPVDQQGVFTFTVDAGQDCNENGIPDAEDVARGSSADCNRNGMPDECEDCTGNGFPDGERDCNRNGISDLCEIELGMSSDCNGNGVPDACDLSFSGESWDANGDGVPDECEGPLPFSLAGGLGGVNPATGQADTFIFPRGEDAPMLEVPLEAAEPLALHDRRLTTTDPDGVGFMIVRLSHEDAGLHRLEVRPTRLAQWLKLELNVVGSESGRAAVLTVWLGHLPLDVNQDGVVDIRDATAFGNEFRGRAEPLLVDLNGDGQVNVLDATWFGQLWEGRLPDTAAWRGSELPPKP